MHLNILQKRFKDCEMTMKNLGIRNPSIRSTKDYTEACREIYTHCCNDPIEFNEYIETHKTEMNGLKYYEESNGRHYVIAKDFYKTMVKSSKKLNLEIMPTNLLIPEDSSCYEIELPTQERIIIKFRHSEDQNDFNIIFYIFMPLELALKNGWNDFSYYILIADKNKSCKDMLDVLFNAMDSQYVENKDLLLNYLKNRFNEIVNLMLYINTGEPDIRHMRTKKPKGSMIKKALKKKNITEKEYYIVGYSFKKETLVPGFFRWQAYGPKHSLRRWQFIPSFTKNKKE